MNDHALFRQAVLWTLLLSIPLLVLMCAIVAGPAGLSLAFAYPIQTVVAFAVMLAFGWWAAPRCGPVCLRHGFLAGLFAVAVFLIGVVSGSVTSMVLYHNYSPFDYLVKPLWWMGLFGALPAFLVGLIGRSITQHLLES